MPKVRKVTNQRGDKFQYNEGMEGVIATASDICYIDGQNGGLLYRGIPIETLAEQSTFEECSYLLLYNKLPTQQELNAFRQRLAKLRKLPEQILSIMTTLPAEANAMQMLRTVVSMLGLYDDAPKNDSVEKNTQRAEQLIAVFPTIVATLQRLRRGLDPITPDPNLSHAENFLYMLNGEKPDAFSARTLDVCLILHAEHGFNASTFTARVIISTLTDMYSAITGAIGSLKGPLHGGANEGVMDLLDEIGSLERTEETILHRLKTRAKIMGFGHRVYKVVDPRASILMKYSEKLAEVTGNETYYAISKKIEEIMAREVGSKGIYPNVDFFSASVYHYLGVERQLFTPIFAVSRIAGWAAHVLEQLRDNRLFRPTSVYLGEYDAPFVPLTERK